MDPIDFTPRVYTPFAELDLLLSEVDQDEVPVVASFAGTLRKMAAR